MCFETRVAIDLSRKSNDSFAMLSCQTAIQTLNHLMTVCQTCDAESEQSLFLPHALVPTGRWPMSKDGDEQAKIYPSISCVFPMF